MNSKYNGKKILLVSPKFFGYENEIRDELIHWGAIVDWLPDRPFNAPMFKALVKIWPTSIFPLVDSMYERLINKYGAKYYDYILVINGQTLSSDMLRLLRSNFPAAHYVLYLWDSLNNRKHIQRNFEMFDRIFTFDPNDALSHSLSLRPLFFGRKFCMERMLNQEPRYQISFIGTAHTDRFAVVNRIRASLPLDINTYWYLYLQAPWVLSYYKIVNSDMRQARFSDFNFEPLSKEEVQLIFAQSRAILDIEHFKQRGLTIRTFETLGSEKKLITTNSDVRKYDFFLEDNICVIDRTNPVIPKKFLETPYVPLTVELKNRYSINGWLQEILA